MIKYLFIYRNPSDEHEPSPEEIQAALEHWGAWIGKYSASGNVVDGGDGLKASGRVIRNGGVVSDGPFAESKEVLGGYSIIAAQNYDEALRIAKECPCLMSEGSIEIRELAGFN